MLDQLLIPLSYLGEDAVISTVVGPFIRFWVLVGMFIAVMLPIFAIPYIFIKMGSVAGQVQAKISNTTRNARRSATKTAAGAAKGYAKREASLRAREYGARNPNSRMGRAINYGDNRKAKTASRETELKRALEHQRNARIASDPAYARSMAGVGSASRAQTIAAAHMDKAYEQEVAESASRMKRQFNYGSDDYDAIAQGHRTTHADGSAVSKEDQSAAVRWVMGNGNFQQRRAVYESIDQNTDQAIRQTVGEQFYAKGDNAVLGSGFGGQLQTGTSGGAQGVANAAANNIQAGKIKAQDLVHDADATELLHQAATGSVTAAPSAASKANNVDPVTVSPTVSIDASAKAALARSAQEALTNETIKVKATADVFYKPITNIAGTTPASTIVVPHQQQASQGPTPPTPTQQQRQQGGNFNGGPGQGPTPPTP